MCKRNVCLGVMLLAMAACKPMNWSEEGKGALSLHVKREGAVLVKSSVAVEDYEIKLETDQGDVLMTVKYNELPDPILLDPGSYTVTSLSEFLDAPAFDRPVYGSTVKVVVEAGIKNTLQMVCSQVNAGIRVVYSPEFKAKYTSYNVEVLGSDGPLVYTGEELRTGYFSPGKLDISLRVAGLDPYTISKNVVAKDMLVLTVLPVPEETSAEQGFTLSLSVDTARVWRREEWKPGALDNDGSSPDKAYTVSEVQALSLATDVWVCGYIVGGDVTTTALKTALPFTSNTHLALADSPLETIRAQCMAVELPASPASLRATFGMPANGSLLLGHRCCFKGSVTSYFGHQGLKATKEGLKL